MKSTFKIVSIIGSPHERNSNTRALVDDFIEELSRQGLELEHELISLGKKEILPCRGC
jgi:multimeric flavodoxin WrbA